MSNTWKQPRGWRTWENLSKLKTPADLDHSGQCRTRNYTPKWVVHACISEQNCCCAYYRRRAKLTPSLREMTSKGPWKGATARQDGDVMVVEHPSGAVARLRRWRS